MKKKAKLASITIINWNNFELTKNCILSVKKNTTYPNYEIYLIDNGSTDGSFEKLKKMFPFLKTIKNDYNTGFSYALNQGYREGKGEYVAHVNNDSIVLKGWLDELVKAIEEDSKIAVVGVREVSEKQANDPKLLEEIRTQKNIEKMTLPVAWLLSKKMIKKIGYLDAEYFSPIYGEEADWNFRARKLGYKIIRVSSSNAIHFGSVDTKKSFGKQKYLVLINYHRLRSMLFNLSIPDLIRFIPGLGLILVKSISEGTFFLILKSYWLNIKDWKLILNQRKNKRLYIPFKEPKFSKTE